MQRKLTPAIGLLRNSFEIFSKNDPLRLAGATAFFATFALPAVLFIIMLILRLALSPQETNEEVFSRLSRYVGRDAAEHLFHVLKAFERIAGNWIATVVGFLFLLFVATTLFKVIKNSLNDLWNIRVVDKLSLRLVVITRSRELAIILSAGVLLLITLLLEAMQVAAIEVIPNRGSIGNTILRDAIGFVVSTLIGTCWFGVIFCYLPDARIPLKVGFAGALATSILFNIGKMALHYVLFYGNLNLVFGRSVSVVLLLLFVFYSSMMFYLGAAFTKVLAKSKNLPIKPLPHAAHYELKDD